MSDQTLVKLPSLSRRRAAINGLTHWLVISGGLAVVLAIVFLMGYLVWVVLPIFTHTSVELKSQFKLDGGGSRLLSVSSNDAFEVLNLIYSNGTVEFRDASTFELVTTAGVTSNTIAEVKSVFPTSDVYMFRDEEANSVGFFQIRHRVRYFDDVRSLEHQVETLFRGTRAQLPDDVLDFDAFLEDDRLTLATQSKSGVATVIVYRDADLDFDLELPVTTEFASGKSFDQLFIGPQGRRLLLLDAADGTYRLLDIRRSGEEALLNEANLTTNNAQITTWTMLLGRYSLLVADSDSKLTQWTLTSTSEGTALVPLRSMDFPEPLEILTTELRRKGFVGFDSAGQGHLGFVTSKRILEHFPIDDQPTFVAFAPRADHIIATGTGWLNTYSVVNPHPEISLQTLWGKVWYEGYEDAVFSWQSSAANTDFEPKFSLTPLLFGTIKAAFYAMLFAIPIAVLGAIYTANFMSASMRSWVKPSIEIMAALPTVILGFIAGLWFAPQLESNLTSILLCFALVPLGLLAFSAMWSRLPSAWTALFDGWYAAISAPVIVALIWFIVSYDAEISQFLFGGDIKLWMYQALGIEYDQRNALVIGIAMGLAVIPTIFSIAEDAIYGVPQHLVHGSLALGATRWQTLVKVVILTASPGIFSAVMIGFGRAVGETMIVLMATGNTPVMDINLFQGMRTFAANIAVEMPESEIDSTHYRILFLTALVLFFITFAFNTAAEVVRNRLRTRYGNL